MSKSGVSNFIQLTQSIIRVCFCFVLFLFCFLPTSHPSLKSPLRFVTAQHVNTVPDRTGYTVTSLNNADEAELKADVLHCFG